MLGILSVKIENLEDSLVIASIVSRLRVHKRGPRLMTISGAFILFYFVFVFFLV